MAGDSLFSVSRNTNLNFIGLCLYRRWIDGGGDEKNRHFLRDLWRKATGQRTSSTPPPRSPNRHTHIPCGHLHKSSLLKKGPNLKERHFISTRARNIPPKRRNVNLFCCGSCYISRCKIELQMTERKCVLLTVVTRRTDFLNLSVQLHSYEADIKMQRSTRPHTTSFGPKISDLHTAIPNVNC
jgi:hypothetical protein